MEKTDLINYYKRSCFIFNGVPVSIEDDEILDLDSISLDSNEDTWLYSNSKSNTFEEASSEEIKQCLDNVSVDDLTRSSSRISLTNWDSFKEQTVDDSFFNQKNTPYRKKLEFNPVQNITPAGQTNGDITTDTLMKNDVPSSKKTDSFPDEHDTFKKPLSKKDISEKNNILYSIENKLFAMGDTDAVDHRNHQISEIKTIERDTPRKLLESVIGQEKNFIELNGSEKRKSLINEPSPLCHSTPMPMLTKRRISRTENENRSWQKSVVQDIGSGDSPFINSSTFGRRDTSVDVCSTGEMSTESKLTEAMTDLSIKEKEIIKGCNGTSEADDNASTSSSDSRRSSSSINYPPRTTTLPSRTLSRPSSSNPRLDSGLNGNIRSPSRASNTTRRAPLTETKMKPPSRRAPSLNRLPAPAPSLNIDEEFVSVVEIKSKDTASKMSDKKTAGGPVSHLPRPSTRIPVFRSSNSCTRTLKK